MLVTSNNSNGRLIKFLVILSLGLSLIYVVRNKDWFRGVVFFLVGPVLLLSPRYLYHKFWSKKYNLRFLNTVESFALPLFILPSLGSLGLYRTKLEYDTFIHAVTPVFLAILIAFFLTYGKLNFSKKELLKIVIATFILTIFLGVLWEVFEWFADKFLGTGMLAGLAQAVKIDTIMDLIADVVGSLVGSTLVFIKWPKWHNSWLKNHQSNHEFLH